MTVFTGTSTNDTFNGTSGGDTFDMFQGGRDTVFGDDGNDTFNFGDSLRDNDVIDGGLGSGDLVSIAGDYSAGLVFKNSTMVNVETIALGSGFSYSLTFRDGNFTGAFTIDGSDLFPAESMTIDASADTDSAITVFDGDGDDVITTGGGNDGLLFEFGNDIAHGGAGVDTFQFNTNTFDAGDFMDGGDGTDFLSLVGDYSAGLTITKDMIDSIEVLFIGGSSSFNFTFANHAADSTMAINAGGIQAGFKATIDAHAEKTANFSFLDGQGNDTFIGGGGSDFCNMSGGAGKETLQTRGGLDTIAFSGNFTNKDKVDGGTGTDQLNLTGDYSGGLNFKPGTMVGIETLIVFAGFSYDLTLDDANIAAGALLTVQCNSFGVLDSLTLDASAETDGALNVTCGIGDDTVTTGDLNDAVAGSDGDDVLGTGQGIDSLNGGLGADTLDGGNQGDTFVYTSVAESTASGHDTLVTFNFNVDKIDLPGLVTGVDAAITVGTLSAATFDGDLATAVNNGNLAVGHAVLFTPNAGDQAGEVFLVVEMSGSAGYQASQDLVIHIDTASNTGSFSTGTFA